MFPFSSLSPYSGQGRFPGPLRAPLALTPYFCTALCCQELNSRIQTVVARVDWLIDWINVDLLAESKSVECSKFLCVKFDCLIDTISIGKNLFEIGVSFRLLESCENDWWITFGPPRLVPCPGWSLGPSRPSKRWWSVARRTSCSSPLPSSTITSRRCTNWTSSMLMSWARR